MLFNLYLISIFYTNTMGLIIMNRCNPFIKREYERKGYRIKEKNDTDYVINIVLSFSKFLIPGYYLKKALKMTGNNFDIEKIIEEKNKNGEIELINQRENVVDSIFRDERHEKILSLSNNEPYIATRTNESMYTKQRYPNTEEFDMDFWEEQEESFTPYIEDTVEKREVNKDPLISYFESMSDDEMNEHCEQIKKYYEEMEVIKELKKKNSNMLNNKIS